MRLLDTIKHLLPALFLAGSCLYTSCVEEELSGGLTSGKEDGLNLTVSVEPMSRKVMTKTAVTRDRTERSRIERLDIVFVGDNETIKEIFPIDSSNEALSAGYKAEDTGLVEQPLPIGDGSKLKLHIGSDKLEGTKEVYLVANYIHHEKGEVSPLKEVLNEGSSNVSDLKALKQGYPKTANAQLVCTMVGKIPLYNTDEHANHVSQEITLTRTISMITVAIDGSNLNKGIVINPQSIQLKNVPNKCSIMVDENGEGNKIENIVEGGNVDVNDRSPEGHIHDGLITGWKFSLAAVGTEGSHKQYFPVDPVDNNNMSLHGSANQYPLYMFENKQGENEQDDVAEGMEKQVNKKPAAGRENYCSYIEVKALYRYDKPVGATVTPDSFEGTITYRFYLGENATTDFNVTRNHHYMLTLKLSGWGGLVEGKVIDGSTYNPNPNEVSWRVDYEETKIVVDKDLEAPVGGSRLDIELNIEGRDLSTMSIEVAEANGVPSTNVWFKRWDKKGPDASWEANNGSVDFKDLLFNKNGEMIANGDKTATLKVYVKPFSNDDFEKIGSNLSTLDEWIYEGYRDLTFNLKSENEVVDVFTIRQWLPLPVMEPGVESPGDAQLYFSRFDIYRGEELPWCSKEFMDKDLRVDGDYLCTENAHLGIAGYTKFESAYGFRNCVAYFVTGMEKKLGIDFNDGFPESVMECAVFEAANAEPITSGNKIFYETPEEVKSMTHYGLASVEEWEKIAKYGVIDSHHALYEGAYWTSSVSEDGYQSLVYHLGSGKVEKMDRNAHFRGRMVYHKNDRANPKAGTH
ncbi:DUF4906 domain-containing protein [Parabacteroides sp.]